MTLVMKGETIPPGTRWHGLPAVPWREKPMAGAVSAATASAR